MQRGVGPRVKVTIVDEGRVTCLLTRSVVSGGRSWVGCRCGPTSLLLVSGRFRYCVYQRPLIRWTQTGVGTGVVQGVRTGVLRTSSVTAPWDWDGVSPLLQLLPQPDSPGGCGQ